jgi:hypothetical protein
VFPVTDNVVMSALRDRACRTFCAALVPRAGAHRGDSLLIGNATC